jgi:arylsulfatase A-like enzyme
MFRAFLLASVLLSSTVGQAHEPRPNIVVLFSDDAGYADFGFQPSVRPEMKDLTPRIDSIAAQGIRFSNAYVTGAVCSPSRAGLMTGRYQQRFGHERNIPPGYMKGGLPLTENFFIQYLKPQGYTCGLIGKWHLGYPEPYQPNARGYDSFFGLLQGSRSYFPIKNPSPHRVFLDNKSPTPEGGYTTDRIGNGACDFIRQHRDKPFFLFVSFTAPHGPLEPKPADEKKLSKIKEDRRRRYAGLVVSLDENVGRILDTLDELGLSEETIVVFTNDNGGQTQTGADNAPLRGRKGQVWEGGIRVPMAIRWPGHTPVGSVVDSPVSTIDFATTIASVSGATIDPAWNLDGMDLSSVIDGRETSLPERDLFWRTSGKEGPIAMRRGAWKLVQLRDQADSEPQLFDLTTDIGEERDVASENPAILDSMKQALDRWESQLVEPLWGGAEE